MCINGKELYLILQQINIAKSFDRLEDRFQSRFRHTC